MNKSELVRKIAERSDVKIVEVDSFLNSFRDIVIEQLLEGEEVSVTGFIKFTSKDTEATTGRNPKTGDKISIPAKRRVIIKAGKILKDKVSESL